MTKTNFCEILDKLKKNKKDSIKITYNEWTEILLLNLPEQKYVKAKDLGFGVIEIRFVEFGVVTSNSVKIDWDPLDEKY